MTLRLLICGTRTFADYALLCCECDAIAAHYSAVEVVSGGANGADLLGERWAHEQGWPVRRFPADWRRHGRAAGPIRNREMRDYLLQSPDRRGVIAFWDGVSRGTGDMIEIAEAAGIPVKIMRP